MGKIIENLRWKPMWVSHVGCIKGCLDHLGIRVTDEWLYGATGHAFIINMHDAVCPSGPTAWNTERFMALGGNLGYKIDGVFGLKTHGDFKEKQKNAWDHAVKSLDRDLPCYGWELDIPEYYVVYGYDATGYYFRGPKCDAGKGPKPWQELGDTQIGCLEMYSVERAEPAPDAQVVKDAFGFVLEHAENPEGWVFPKYRAGLAGFDNWIKALESDNADGFGMAYNSEVWSECREFAVGFLKEAQERLPDRLSPILAESIGHYQTVRDNLKKVAQLFPFAEHSPKHVEDEGRRSAGVEHLRRAREGEQAGLTTLQKMLKEI